MNANHKEIDWELERRKKKILNLEKELKDLKAQVQDYAAFCIKCDRSEMKPLDFEGYLKLKY